MKDWTNDPVWRQFAQHALAEMVPAMSDSRIVVSLAPNGTKSEGDVKYWVELGASIMLDKPILVVASPGQELPERLERVADLIVYADMDTERGRMWLNDAIAEFLEGLE